MAPGQIGLRATSANTAAPSSEPASPASVRPRRARAAPSATSAGPPSIAHHSGNEVSIRSSTPGKRSPNHTCALSSKIAPVGAASWWASTTSVRSACASPQCATTFQVLAGADLRRRYRRGPFEMSSAIAAVTAAAAAPPSRRVRRPSAAIPATAPAAASEPITSAYPGR